MSFRHKLYLRSAVVVVYILYYDVVVYIDFIRNQSSSEQSSYGFQLQLLSVDMLRVLVVIVGMEY